MSNTDLGRPYFSSLYLFPLVLLFSGVLQTARADDVTDLYFQEVIERYFEYPQNARSFGMGGSTVMTESSSASTIGNPAGLAFMQGGELSGSYGHNVISGDEFPTGRSVEQRANNGHALLALPVGPQVNALPRFGNFGFALDTVKRRVG